MQNHCCLIPMGSKKPKGNGLKVGDVDRISDLPDPILIKILSCLPTKNAVATSILSTRWKSLFPFFWVTPIRLDLDDSLLLYPQKMKTSFLFRSFSAFMDRLLNSITLSGVPCVETFILKCRGQYYPSDTLITWVCRALRLNVQHLDLTIFVLESKTLFHCLRGCTTLQSLELGKGFRLCIPKIFSLPNLKSLYLNELAFMDGAEDTINELIVGCPSLETLWMFGCRMVMLEKLYIISPLLKYLTIQKCWNRSRCQLLLDAPNLKVLLYDDCLARNYVVSEFRSLTWAHIHLGPNQEVEKINDYEQVDLYGYGVARLTAACYSTKNLYLSAYAVEALHISSIELSVFQNLIWLKLGCLGLYGWALLAQLLCNAPNLEKLNLDEGLNKIKGGYEKFESLLSTPPICLELHVKEIEFMAFKEEKDEIKLTEYFLKNGKVLRRLTLQTLPFKNGSTLRKLVRLPLKSKIFYALR